MKLENTKLLIVGLGKSGLSAAISAMKNGADVWVSEDNKELESKIANDYNFNIYNKEQENKFDLVVSSPGIAFNHPILRLAALSKWPIASEVEFAYNLLNPQFVIAVTGTNGKTTVVELLKCIYELSKKPFTVAGNIGLPLSSLENVAPVLILELSSFHLHFIKNFRANIGVILNVTEDHLDWHCCFGQYLEDKLNLFKNQNSTDVSLVNASDEALKDISTNGKIKTFDAAENENYGFRNGFLTVSGSNFFNVEDLKIKGKHNISNVLASVACALESGIDEEIVKEGLRTFEGLSHRIQFVNEIYGVKFYNDSKSTNPDSTRKAIESFDSKVILIMGGRNKGNDFSFLKNYLNEKIKKLIIYGEAANEIRNQIGEGVIVAKVEQAIDKSLSSASVGDIVLFSPGCSSFDLFNNYAQRGEFFIKAVNETNV